MDKLKPEEAVRMLKKQGEEVTLEEAVFILDLLRRFSTTVVSQYVEEQRIAARVSKTVSDSPLKTSV